MGLRAFVLWMLKAFMGRSSELGSRTLTHAALAGTQKEMNGCYMSTCKYQEESDYAISDEGQEVQERIWVSDTSAVILLFDHSDSFGL